MGRKKIHFTPEDLTFDHYSSEAHKTAVYPTEESSPIGLIYASLALCGECGEMANKIKKIMRNDYERFPRTLLVQELGDILWYVNACAHELGVPLTAIALENLAKLEKRQKNNTIKGSGDNR